MFCVFTDLNQRLLRIKPTNELPMQLRQSVDGLDEQQVFYGSAVTLGAVLYYFLNTKSDYLNFGPNIPLLVVLALFQFLRVYWSLYVGVFMVVFYLFTRWRELYRGTNVGMQTVLITGAGSGIGRLMAVECARRNAANVILCDINVKGSEATAKMIEKVNASKPKTSRATTKAFVTPRVDVSSESDIKSLKAFLEKNKLVLDILINNAGIVQGRRMTDQSLTPHHASFTVGVNCLSNFIMLHHLLPGMMSRKKGHIVTIASTMGMVPCGGLSDYNASKFGQVGMHNSVRLELSRDCPEIRMLLVCPHMIDTGMFDGTFESQDIGTRIAKLLIPLLRPEFVAKRVIDGIEQGDSWIVTPVLMRYLPVLFCLIPVELYHGVLGLIGSHSAMDTFRGRRPTAGKKNKES